MKLIFDTYAWIEYFIGSKKGEVVKSYFDNEILTPTLVLMELSYRFDQEGWDFKKFLNFIKSKSTIMGINEDTILEFGKFYNLLKKKEKSISFVDTLIFTLAKLENTKILTGDLHFKEFENVEFLK